jgi:hypothetical protein
MRHIQQIIEYFLRKKWLGILLITLLVSGVGVSTIYRGAFSQKQRTDLAVFFKAAEMVHEGRANHIYGIETRRHWHYVYTPLLAILLAPAVGLPFVIPVTIHYVMSLAGLGIIFFLSRHFTSDKKNAVWQIVLSALLCIPVFLDTLTRGQLGILMLFFQAVIFFSYLKNHKILAGFLLALAVSLKTSPLAVLFVYFLFRKEWFLLLSAACGLVFFIFLYPSVIIGFEENWELLTIWHGLMKEGSSINAYKNYLWSELFTPFAADNQSFYAVLTRFCWRGESDFIANPSHGVRWISLSMGIISVLLLFIKHTRPAPKSGEDVSIEDKLVEFSLYPVAMLLFSPVTQIHHYVSLYFMFLAAFFLWNRKKTWLPLAGVFCSASLFLLALVIEPLAYLGFPMWGAFILWGILLFCPTPSAKSSGGA